MLGGKYVICGVFRIESRDCDEGEWLGTIA